jgi:nicotinamide-nucleotide amidase
VGVQGADGGEGADGGARHGRQYLFTRVVKLCAIGEPAVEDAVRDLIHSSNPTVAPLVAVGETHLRVTAKAADADQARDLVDRTVRVIEERLGEYIFGYDADSLAKAVGALLKAKGLSLAVAESLTGGLVGHLLTDVPGSSDYFDRDVVAYSNRAKTEVLGVSPETIARHGAVSEETAREMATGVRRMSGADVGVALTGIAGPGGGTPEKPVGLVYIAVARSVTGRETSGLDVSCHRVIFSGERWLVKRRAAHRALTLLWRLLQA